MAPRPKKDTLESLRVTLQKIEQTADPARDAESIAQLKRILVNRIADLELLEALTPDDLSSSVQPKPADLIPPSPTEPKPPAEEGETLVRPDIIPPDKTD